MSLQQESFQKTSDGVEPDILQNLAHSRVPILLGCCMLQNAINIWIQQAF